jgi:hypothetical protein
MFDDYEQSGWFSHQDAFQTVESPVYAGSRAIKLDIKPFNEYSDTVAFTMGWTDSFHSGPFDRIEFMLNGGPTGGQKFAIKGRLRDAMNDKWGTGKIVELPQADGKYLAGGLTEIPANKWVKVSIPLEDLGVANNVNFHGIAFTNKQPDAQKTLFVDEIKLRGTIPTKVKFSVDATKTIRRINGHLYGICTYGAAEAHVAPEVAMAKDAGYGMHRAFYPTFNIRNGFRDPDPQKGVLFAEATGADSMVCVNYTDSDSIPDNGKWDFGTPQEAAAFVAWANIGLDAPRKILDLDLGVDVHGRNVGTVRRWAEMRASQPLAQNDGLNNLRIGRTKAFGVKLWELDNEPWLRPERTDWLGYANFCKEADALMKKVDPTIKTGITIFGSGEPGIVKRVVKNPTTGRESHAFEHVVSYYLAGHDQQLSPGRLVPDFVVIHNYAGINNGPSANLGTLLTMEQRGRGDWVSIQKKERGILRDYWGAKDGEEPILIVSEHNISATFPLTKQTRSLVSALYVADSLGSIMQFPEGEFEGMAWHDWDDGPLHKGSYSENSALYAWRNEAGYGVYGQRERDGNRTKYPAHYAFKMMSHYFGKEGDAVVPVESSSMLLKAYAAKQKNGNLAVLVINKTRDNVINATFDFVGYSPTKNATIYHYGKEEDRSEADISVAPVAYDAAKGFSFAPYSMTVVTFTQNAATPPTAPQNVQATPGNKQVKLIWPSLSGATGYDVFRVVKGKETPVKTGLTTTTLVDANLPNGVPVGYRIAARGGGKVGPKSEIISATPLAPPAAAPANLRVVAGAGQVRLSWESVASATSYTVERVVSGKKMNWETITTHPYRRNLDQSISRTVYTDGTVRAGEKYLYRVKAVNLGGAGPATSVETSAQPAVVDGWASADRTYRNDGFTAKNGGAFLVEGSGAAWYGISEGRFVYRKLSGDGSISARVEITGGNGLYGKDVSGLMMAKSITKGSNQSAIMGFSSTEGLSFLTHNNGGGRYEGENGVPRDQMKKAPGWVKLERKGNTFKGYHSSDGQNWTPYTSKDLPEMAGDIFVGLNVTSMVYYANQSARFSDVKLEGNITPVS